LAILIPRNKNYTISWDYYSGKNDFCKILKFPVEIRIFFAAHEPSFSLVVHSSSKDINNLWKLKT